MNLLDMAQTELNARRAVKEEMRLRAERRGTMHKELADELKSRLPRWENKYPELCTLGDRDSFFRTHKTNGGQASGYEVDFEVDKGTFFLYMPGTNKVARHHNVHASVVVDVLIECLIPHASGQWIQAYINRVKKLQEANDES